MAFFSLGNKSCKDYQDNDKANHVVKIVAQDIIKSHKATGESRHCPADLIEYLSESGNNESHYEYDNYDTNRNANGVFRDHQQNGNH